MVNRQPSINFEKKLIALDKAELVYPWPDKPTEGSAVRCLRGIRGGKVLVPESALKCFGEDVKLSWSEDMGLVLVRSVIAYESFRDAN